MMPALPRSSWYRATADAGTISPEVAERALEWLVELQTEPVPAGVIEEWNRWRSAHPDHERAWRRIESVSARLQPLSAPVQAAIAKATLAPARSPQRRLAIKTLGLLLFAGSAAWTIEEYAPWQEWSADQRTAVGEHRVMTLADGTQVVLNTDSAVNIRFSDTERRIVLVSGEVLITTAKDQRPRSRPFLVETAQGVALALGTRYSVRLRDDDTRVGVFEGAVEIRPRDATGQSLVLRAGQQASYSASAITPLRPVDEASVAWSSGFIVARSMRLDDFAAELDRYTPDRLTCDPTVANLRVSGSFPLDNIGKVLETLTATLGIRAERVTRFLGYRTHVRLTARGQAA